MSSAGVLPQRIGRLGGLVDGVVLLGAAIAEGVGRAGLTAQRVVAQAGFLTQCIGDQADVACGVIAQSDFALEGFLMLKQAYARSMVRCSG